MTKKLPYLLICLIYTAIFLSTAATSTDVEPFEEFIPYSLGMRGIAWNPVKEDMAIITSDEGYLYFCSTSSATRYSLYGELGEPLIDVSWKPDGSYALAVGRKGRIVEYVENTQYIGELNVSTNYDLIDICWSPEGSYALVLGQKRFLYERSRVILMFNESDKGDLRLLYQERFSVGSNSFNDIAWKPHNLEKSYNESALIVGDNIILEYNGLSFTRINTSNTLSFKAVDWKPGDTYALIVDSYGNLYVYNGKNLTITYSNKYYGNFENIAWKPDGGYALIVGRKGRILKYFDDGMVLEMDYNKDVNFNDVAWKPDGSYALLSTNEGTVVKYTPLPLIPKLSVKENSKSFKPGESVIFSASYSPYSDDRACNYFFDFGDGSSSGWTNDTSITHVFRENGVYSIKVKLKDCCGNESEWSKPLQILVYEEGSLFDFIESFLLIVFVGLSFILGSYIFVKRK